MNDNPDEIIVMFLNELNIDDILRVRFINAQFYRCSFSVIPFINRIADFFRRCPRCDKFCLHRLTIDIYEVSKKISNFDYAIDENHAIKWAAHCGHVSIVKDLVDSGVDIHFTLNNPLHLAAEQKHMDIVEYLVEKGVDVYSDNIVIESTCFQARMKITIRRVLEEANAQITEWCLIYIKNKDMHL